MKRPTLPRLILCLQFFSVFAAGAGKPTLISPSGNITTASPTYAWTAVASATWYRLWVNEVTASPKIIQWYKAADTGCASGTGTCSITPGIALAAGACRWWVQAYDVADGPWSDGMDFAVTLGAPSKATLLSPTGSISTSNPTYTWSAVSSATWYLLWVNDSGTQAKINQWYKAADAGCGSGTGTCAVTPSVSLASGNGQWWIQTWNESGYGPWSDGMVFSVQPGGLPGKAVLISPSGNTSGTSPRFTWNAVANATWYLLWVDDSGTQAKINQWYKAADVGCSSGSGTCAVTPSVTLASGSGQWWVQTWNESGYGPWSDGMVFNIQTGGAPGKAVLISPNGSISTTTPTYTWNAVPTSTWYYLSVDDTDVANRVLKWYTASEAGCASGTGTCSVTPATAVSAGGCQWWIQTYNDYGYGPWSDAMSFTAGTISSTGFNEQFTGTTAPNWMQDSGSWIVFRSYYQADGTGLADKYGTSTYNTQFSDLDYSASMIHQEAESNQYWNAAGLAIRVSGNLTQGDPASGYFFQYYGDGTYSVWKNVNGTSTNLKALTAHSAIKAGAVANKLRVIAKGSSLWFFINDVVVWQGSDTSHSSGRVGLQFFSEAGSASDRLQVDYAILTTNVVVPQQVLSDQPTASANPAEETTGYKRLGHSRWNRLH